MRENSQLFITIDVEPDCGIKWQRSNPLEFTSITYGIPKLLRPIWNKHNIKPIYFISPEVIQNKECCAILKSEINKGAIIGTHLHSEFIPPNMTLKNPAGKISEEFPCYAHSTKVEYLKIKNLTKLIKRKLGVRPIWYRAARFGADFDTIKTLKKLGYKYDSSVTPGIKWHEYVDHSMAQNQPYMISKDDYYKPEKIRDGIGIREYPVTIDGKRFGFFGKLLPNKWYFYAWLRPSHVFLWEMKLIANKFIRKYKNPVIVIMFHSMEIIPKKSPFVRNRFMQKLFLRRLDSIIKYLHKKGIK